VTSFSDFSGGGCGAVASRDGGISDTKLLSHAIGECLLNTVKAKRRDIVKKLGVDKSAEVDAGNKYLGQSMT